VGRRGPIAQPPHLRVLRGDGRPSRARPPVEAAIPEAVPEPPAWLPEQARAEWRCVSPELHRLGLLTELDLQPFSAWCCAVARWKAASEALQATPAADRLIVRGKVNPLVRIAHTAADEMQKLGAMFGLAGPVSRARLVGHGKQQPAGKFHGLLGRGE